MAFNVAGLGNYTRENLEPLLTQAVFADKFQQLVVSKGILMTKVKSADKIPLFETDAVFQTDSCSFDPSGTTTFTQRSVTVGKIKVEEKLCPKDLETKFTQEALRAGSTYEDFGNPQFEQAYMTRKAEIIAKQNAIALWQGDTGSGDANLNKFDGLIKLIDAGSPIDANVSGYTGIATVTTITSSNVLAVVKGCKNAFPASMKGRDDLYIFCGFDVFDLYIDAGISANLFNYSYNDNASGKYEMKIPGSNITLCAVHGLDGTGDLYGFRMANVAMAVDVEAEETNMKLWYSQDNNDVRFRVAWKMGINVAFTNECVKFKAAI